MNEYKNAVGYVRVSTDNQVGDDKFGIEAQRQSILLYANDNGYNIVKWYIEKGISGTKENRPELDKIMFGEEVTNPPYEAVIVAKSDRLSRDMKMYFYYLYSLEKRNIKLISVNENFDENNELSGIYRALMLFVASQERKNIASRTGNGRKIKASAGGYSGGRNPYGYFVKNGQLVINDSESKMVKLIFEMLTQNKTLQDIADYLNENNYKTRSNKKFYPSHIKAIKDNKLFYQGYYKYGKNMNWVKGIHTPILEGIDNENK